MGSVIYTSPADEMGSDDMGSDDMGSDDMGSDMGSDGAETIVGRTFVKPGTFGGGGGDVHLARRCHRRVRGRKVNDVVAAHGGDEGGAEGKELHG